VSKELKRTEDNETMEKGRRDLIKKAVYIAPTIVVLGVLTPIFGNAQSLPDCPPDAPSGYPGC
jgi:hypothetical protein